jgi:hypothetical protein
MNKDNLITISTYAKSRSQSTQNIYKMINEGKIKHAEVEIDGVKFLDKSKLAGEYKFNK